MDYYYWAYKDLIPDGYISGLVRDPYETNKHVAHLYKGTVENPGDPMCKRGWNRGKFGYSIWRNNIGQGGLCKICLRRANEGREPIPFPYEENIEDDEEI